MRRYGLTLLCLVLLVIPAWAQETVPSADAAEEAMKQQVVETIQTAIVAAKANMAAGIDETPPVPTVIANEAENGAQIQYLGEVGGFTGWIILDEAGATYAYVNSDESMVFQGLLFDNKGQSVTIGQLAAARVRNPAFFGLVGDEAAQASATETVKAAPKPAAEESLSETLYKALARSNFVRLGAEDTANAPILYGFMDPDCPHCHDFLKEIETEYLATKKIQLRIVPIGLLSAESARRAAYLLVQPDAGAQLLAHAKGAKEMPAPEGVVLDGQQRNLDLFKTWRFDGTPIFVYKTRAGDVMMIRGAPKDMKAVVGSMTTGIAP